MTYIDIHSHILPTMDDGSKSLEESLDMLRIAQKEGITHMIATPHYKSGHFRADSREVNRRLEELQSAAVQAGLTIKLYPGTEIFYRSEIEDRLEQGELCTMNHTDFILVEFSPLEDYIYIRNAVNDIYSMGYRPILAHVKRYRCMLQDEKRVEDLKSMGCGIQVNAGSIAGNYGLRIRHYTQKLLRKELVDYIGTDTHNTGERCPAMRKCADIIYRKCNSKYADSILFGNARDNLHCGTD